MITCSNIWRFDGDCSGQVLFYRVSDKKGPIYDEETKAPFERLGHSIKGAFEVQNFPGEGAVLAPLCEGHLAKLAELHPDWQIKESPAPVTESMYRRIMKLA